MAPTILSILHLGDVHYPQAMSTPILDRKDSGMSPQLVGRSAPSRFVEVVRSIQNEITRTNIDAFIVVGDLTTSGSISGYSECVAFLKTAFVDGRFESKLDAFRVLPGNHDLRRNSTMDVPLEDKFQAFLDIVRAAGFVDFPIEGIDRFDIGDSAKGTARLWLANSCVGCGEVRRLPPFVGAAITQRLAGITDTDLDTNDDLRAAMYEAIDTPIIDEEVISTFVADTNSDSEKRLPILCAHHNLLPQYRPRISVYGEMLNAGYIRRRLLDLPRPIVYLHGHVHDDPIEIIRSPDTPRGQIIFCGRAVGPRWLQHHTGMLWQRRSSDWSEGATSSAL